MHPTPLAHQDPHRQSATGRALQDAHQLAAEGCNPDLAAVILSESHAEPALKQARSHQLAKLRRDPVVDPLAVRAGRILMATADHHTPIAA